MKLVLSRSRSEARPKSRRHRRNPKSYTEVCSTAAAELTGRGETPKPRDLTQRATDHVSDQWQAAAYQHFRTDAHWDTHGVGCCG